MKAESVNAVSKQSLSSSLETNNGGKYGGLIQQSIFVRTRNELLRLFSFIHTSTSTNPMIYSIVTIIRILQLIGPVISCSNQAIWPKGQKERSAISVLSVTFHLFPPDYRDSMIKLFSIIYIIINIIVLVTILVCSRYFALKANLNITLANTISLYYATFGECFHPIALNLVFEKISIVVFSVSGIINISKLLILEYCVIILALIHILLAINITSQGLSFRSASCMTVSMIPQILLFISTPIITIMYAFNSNCPHKIQPYIFFFGSIMYCSTLFIGFTCGGFVDESVNCSILSVSIAGTALSVYFGICIIKSINSNMEAMLFCIWLYTICFILWKKRFRKIKMEDLIILDQIAENDEEFELISSPSHLMRIAIAGFSTAHPTCLNWTIFKNAVDKWQKDTEVWYSFAKFIAIYPEENQTLIWIFNTVTSLKLRGNSARTLKMECIAISREREIQLSPQLKTKLNTISKQAQGTKHKLRNVWDLALQGNIGEMENALQRAADALDKCKTDYHRLLSQYPNNRFVTRAYSHFLYEVEAKLPESKEMMEKTKMLQRGVVVNQDKMQKLGLDVFHALPSEIKRKDKSMNESHPLYLSDALQVSTNDFETETIEDLDKKDNSLIREKIDNLVFPAIYQTTCFQITSFTILFLSFFSGLLVVFNYIQSDLLSPVEYIYQLSKLRHNTVFSTAFSARLVFEKLQILEESVINEKNPPKSLGGTWDIKEQLTYMMSDLSQSAQIIEDLRNFKNGEVQIENMKSILFEPQITYKMMRSPTDFIERNFSIQEAVIDLLIQCDKISKINESSITYSYLDTSPMLNPNANLDPVLRGVNEALLYFNDYIISTNNKYQNIFLYGFISIIIIIIIVFIGLMIHELKTIDQNKNETYRCLTSIPKSIVSSIADGLRTVKAESDGSSIGKDSEISKQEENMIKVFNNGTSGHTSSSNSLPIISSTILIIILHMAGTYFFFDLGTFQSTRLKQSVPHLDYLYASVDLVFGAIYSLINMAASLTEHYIKGRTTQETKNLFLSRIDDSLKYYHLSSFGGRSIDDRPFLNFVNMLDESILKSTCNVTDIKSTDLVSILKCYRVDVLYGMVSPFLKEYVVNYQSKNVTINTKDRMIRIIWDILIDPVYETFFYPMVRDIIPTITEELNEKQSTVFMIILAILIIGSVIEILLFIQIKSIDSHMRFVLMMLLHCPESVLFQTPKVRSVLSGVFTSANINAAKKNADFYDDVLQCIPDGIVCLSSQNIVCFANKSTPIILNTPDVIGKDITEILPKDRISGDISSLLTSGSKNSIQFIRDNESQTNLDIITQMINGLLTLIITDSTPTVRYNSLIAEEREKSDKLLSAILPPKLVKRVQSGEKNISFAVQSASILFIDIVEFTPWCGSLPATVVMSTLNSLFKKFDACIAKYPSMTKIKCIGDCYMAAGGIFSEINQPATHAKESVSFGLDAIQAVKDINKELGISLRIRVGINTGGPLVAGVLGIGKPTFEIFGPLISIAQQMEHHGIPMAVHISRPVYELIYGNSFNVKERGSIDIKTGSVVTYLVT